jgi:tetratricopeptide (TPR) repeat protein
MSDNNIIEKAHNLFEENQYNDCLEIISDYINATPDNDSDLIECLLLRGDVYRKLAKFGNALRDYRSVIQIDKDNTIAQTKIGLVENILSIENTFYYENPYTDMDLLPEM